jgi:hypothetical protein
VKNALVFFAEDDPSEVRVAAEGDGDCPIRELTMSNSLEPALGSIGLTSTTSGQPGEKFTETPGSYAFVAVSSKSFPSFPNSADREKNSTVDRIRRYSPIS